jgi:ABC-type transport system involved in cytochrome bd biosynthesis fused ATPase/permease subunit
MSLLGETLSSNMSGGINGPVAYAAQDAFIFPGSVRDNIVCGHAFDEATYSCVLTACALQQDFQRMPNGDQTTLGDKGLTLSGGQKQRIVRSRRLCYASAFSERMSPGSGTCSLCSGANHST